MVRFYRPFVGQVRDTANTIEILIFVTILQTLGPQYAKESEKYKPKERTSDPMLNIVGSGKENLNPNLPIEETIKVKVEPNSSSNNLSVPEGTSKLSTSSNASVTEGRPLKIKIRLDPSKRSRDSAGSATDLQQQQQQQQHLQHQQIQPVVKPAPVRTAWQQTQQVPSSFIPNTKQGTIPKMIIPITSSPAQPTFSPVSSSCASSNFATTPTTASYATSTATSTPRSIMSNLKDRSIPSEKKKVNFPRNNSDLVKVKVEEDDSLVKQMNKMGISESEDMDNDIELVCEWLIFSCFLFRVFGFLLANAFFLFIIQLLNARRNAMCWMRFWMLEDKELLFARTSTIRKNAKSLSKSPTEATNPAS